MSGAGWQIALSNAVEELQRLPPLALDRSERALVGVYIDQLERALDAVAGRCPGCLTPLGARHYCYERRGTYRTFDEVGVPEDDPRRGALA